MKRISCSTEVSDFACTIYLYIYIINKNLFIGSWTKHEPIENMLELKVDISISYWAEVSVWEKVAKLDESLHDACFKRQDQK